VVGGAAWRHRIDGAVDRAPIVGERQDRRRRAVRILIANERRGPELFLSSVHTNKDANSISVSAIYTAASTGKGPTIARDALEIVATDRESNGGLGLRG
jgi:hypothetical protein